MTSILTKSFCEIAREEPNTVIQTKKYLDSSSDHGMLRNMTVRQNVCIQITTTIPISMRLIMIPRIFWENLKTEIALFISFHSSNEILLGEASPIHS